MTNDLIKGRSMNNKVIKITGLKKKDVQSKLKLKYPRAQIEYEFIEIPHEECKIIPDEWLSKGNLVKFKKNFPHKDYSPVINKDLDYLMGRYLAHVLFNVLKELYGFPPEIITGVLDINNKSIIPNPFEWSYLILGPEGTYFEIMDSLQYVRPRFVLWKRTDLKEKQKPLPKQIIESILEFCSLINSLIDYYDNEYSIENEEILRKPAIRNLYFQHISSAEDFMDLAQEVEDDIDNEIKNMFNEGFYFEEKDDYVDEARSKMTTRNSLYVASIINSLLAIEGFINILYELLILKQYKNEKYERSTIRADIDLRILQLPIYCNGFTRTIIDPEADIFKKLKLLTKYRNNLIHANITEENKFTSIIDNGYFFMYDILRHRKKMKNKKMHTAHGWIGEKDAKYVMALAKEIVQTIIGWMDEKEEKWVRGWINKEVI